MKTICLVAILIIFSCADVNAQRNYFIYADTAEMRTVYSNGASFAASRDASSGTVLNAPYAEIGTATSGNRVNRFFAQFAIPTLDLGTGIDSAKIFLHTNGNYSSADFNILVGSSYWRMPPSGDMFNDIIGWAGSGAYSGFSSLVDTFSSANYRWEIPLKLTAKGIDTIAAHLGDTLRVAMISTYDSASVSPGINSFIYICTEEDSVILVLYTDATAPPYYPPVYAALGMVLSGATDTTVHLDSLLRNSLDTCDSNRFAIYYSSLGAWLDTLTQYPFTRTKKTFRPAAWKNRTLRLYKNYLSEFIIEALAPNGVDSSKTVSQSYLMGTIQSEGGGPPTPVIVPKVAGKPFYLKRPED